MNFKRVTLWLITASLLLALAACSSTTTPVGPTPDPTPPPPDENGSIPFEGTLTLSDYDDIQELWLGVVDLDLSTGQKSRVLEGAFPWRHPSGKVVFAQGCGQLANRIVVAEGGLITPVTPCSSEIEYPEASSNQFEFSRLSPDQQKVATEIGHYVSISEGNVYDTYVYNLSGTLLATFEGTYAPAWLPDGRLLFATRDRGIYMTDAQLQNPVRIDGNQLNGPVSNMDVHPSGTFVAFEYNQQIWLLDLSTGGVRELITGSKRLRFPTFSPDGVALAYLATSQGEDYDQVIYFTDLQTGEGYALDFLTDSVFTVPNGPLSWTP